MLGAFHEPNASNRSGLFALAIVRLHIATHLFDIVEAATAVTRFRPLDQKRYRWLSRHAHASPRAV